MTDLQLFANPELGEIRTILIDAEPWFVGKDIAKILGYRDHNKTLSTHVDDEDKGVAKWDTPGGRQNITVINESGLYSLILSSKLPKAKQFKRWVTSEVLPTIRKTGSYISVQAFDDLEKRVKKIEAKALMPIKSSQYSIGVNTSEIAYSLGIPPKRLFDFLIATGIVYRKWDKYELHNDYVGFGYIQNVRKSQETCNCKRIKYWTLQGVRFVTDLYNNIATGERVTG